MPTKYTDPTKTYREAQANKKKSVVGEIISPTPVPAAVPSTGQVASVPESPLSVQDRIARTYSVMGMEQPSAADEIVSAQPTPTPMQEPTQTTTGQATAAGQDPGGGTPGTDVTTTPVDPNQLPYGGMWEGYAAGDFAEVDSPWGKYQIPKKYTKESYPAITGVSGLDFMTELTAAGLTENVFGSLGLDPAVMSPDQLFAAVNERLPQHIENAATNLAALYRMASDMTHSSEYRASAMSEVAERQARLDELISVYNRIKSIATSGSGDQPPAGGGGTVDLPGSGTGGTPGEGTVGGGTGTGTGTTTPTTGTPPVTETTPFAEGDLTKTAQQRLDEFLQTDPTQHQGGIVGWMKDRESLRNAVKAEASVGGTATTTTGGTAQKALDDFLKTDITQHPDGIVGWMKERDRLRAAAKAESDAVTKTTVTEGDTIESDAIANPVVDGFLNDLIKNGYKLSSEEEATIRKNVDTAIRQSLSSLSGRGLGRGSEAAGAIVQGEIAKEQQVGEAKARVRKEGTEAGLKAAELVQRSQEMNQNKTNADRNYQLAVSGQNLEALKNDQSVSFQDRAMQLKTMETTAAIKTMEKEFGLKIDELEWKKFIETGELNAKVFDIVGTQRLNEIKTVNDYWLAKSDLELREQLGIEKLDLERWIAGEQVDLDKAAMAMERSFGLMGFQVERAKIEAALQAANSGDDTWAMVMGILSIGANIAVAV